MQHIACFKVSQSAKRARAKTVALVWRGAYYPDPLQIEKTPYYVRDPNCNTTPPLGVEVCCVSPSRNICRTPQLLRRDTSTIGYMLFAAGFVSSLVRVRGNGRLPR